jgi:signal peptidase II
MDFKYAKWIWLAAVVLVVAGADQLTKRWAVSALAIPVRGTYAHPCDPDGPARERTIMRPARRIQVIEGYFDLRYSENCGGVFSILHDQKESIRRPFFYLTHSIAALLLFYLFFKTGRGTSWTSSTGIFGKRPAGPSSMLPTWGSRRASS